MSAGTQLTPQSVDGAFPEGRSLLAHLIHALNQPLTGLQCSMEVALASPRQTEQYLNTLREGLTLTSRMRILVESIREVADQESERASDRHNNDRHSNDRHNNDRRNNGGPNNDRPENDRPENDRIANDAPKNDRFLFDRLLRETVADLHPVAESRNVQLLMACQPSLPVLGDRRVFAALLFRFLESAITLAGEGTELRVAAARDTNRGQLAVSWIAGRLPEHSPFSRPELGIMIAQAGWRRAGADWERRRVTNTETCTIRLPLAAAETTSAQAGRADSKPTTDPNQIMENLK
jgi:hypothetical protein